VHQSSRPSAFADRSSPSGCRRVRERIPKLGRASIEHKREARRSHSCTGIASGTQEYATLLAVLPRRVVHTPLGAPVGLPQPPGRCPKARYVTRPIVNTTPSATTSSPVATIAPTTGRLKILPMAAPAVAISRGKPRKSFDKNSSSESCGHEDPPKEGKRERDERHFDEQPFQGELRLFRHGRSSPPQLGAASEPSLARRRADSDVLVSSNVDARQRCPHFVERFLR
jgi:hypothetical protein